MDTYLANPNLKRAHVPIEFTAEQVEEVIKCSQDVVYFIENYVKIINLDEGLVPFNMYPFQQDMANMITDNRFSVIKTCRQAGKTTTSAAVILWHVLFNESYTIAILANKLSTAREILSRVQRAYENLPMWLQQGVIVWNKTSIELENGSQIIASSTASSAIRGYSINFLYLDEFAFVPRNIQDDFFTSVYPTIISGTNTKVVITSTPNGFDLFYKIWINSVENRNEYSNFMVNWWDVPGRDEEWKQKTIANTSEDQFRQEFDAEFLGSANTLISPNILKILAFIDPKSKHYDGSLSIYEEPKDGRNYFLVADVSRGVGIDSSAFLVYDVTEMPYKVVAAYKNNLIEPILYPEIIYQVARSYREAFVMIEINDNGQQIADILHQDLEYENIVYTTVKGRAGQVLGAGFAPNTQRGVRTTKQVKRLGCVNMKTMIEKQQIILNDFNVINELSTFIHRGNGYEAESGAHDDLVMCIVLLAWATTQTFFKELTDTDFRAKILAEREKMWEDEVLPFAFYDDGQSDENTVNINTYDEGGWLNEDSLNKW
jgi:hypothetical protein